MKWTEERVKRFRGLWATGMSASDMATEFGVTRYAIHSKARSLGLARERAWVPDEDADLIAVWKAMALADMAQRFMRTEAAILERGATLGLPALPTQKAKPSQAASGAVDLALAVRRDKERAKKALEGHQGRGTPCACGCGQPLEAADRISRSEGVFSAACLGRLRSQQQASGMGFWWVRP